MIARVWSVVEREGAYYINGDISRNELDVLVADWSIEAGENLVRDDELADVINMKTVIGTLLRIDKLRAENGLPRFLLP